jgi:hypothetical protein
MSPGETEAGSAGKQLCRGIARWKLIEDDAWGDDLNRRPPFLHRIDRFPHALKIPARSAEFSLTQIGLTPIPAEPRHIKKTRRTPDEDLELARCNKSKHERGLA